MVVLWEMRRKGELIWMVGYGGWREGAVCAEMTNEVLMSPEEPGSVSKGVTGI